MKESSASHYLLQKLALFGVQGLPPGTLGALAEHAVSLAKSLRAPPGESEDRNIIRMLDGQAAIVSAILSDSRDAGGKPSIDGQMRDEVAAILVKHGVEVPDSTH